jgi:hypothetical protein
MLVLLGAWGGLIAFVGPYFNYAYTPDRAWAFNSGRFWLSLLPGAITVFGGLIVFFSANRAIAALGAWLAALSGVWFVIGGPISTLVTSDGSNAAGAPVGSTTTQALAQLGFFTGLGAAVVFFAALALGRFTVVGARDVALAEREAAEQAALDQALARDAERRAAAREEAANAEKHEEAANAETAEAARTAEPTPAPDRTEELPPAATTYPRPDDEPSRVTTRATRRPDERPRTTTPADDQPSDRPRAST